VDASASVFLSSRRSESNALAAGYGPALVPNVAAVAGPGVEPGVARVMSPACKPFHSPAALSRGVEPRRATFGASPPDPLARGGKLGSPGRS
jgi:hypothetical protein